MANKVIRNYVPGQNDFLHFAEVMNRNAEIDLSKSRGQSAGIAAMPQMSGSARDTQIQGNLKSALDGRVNEIDTSYKSNFGGKV